MLEKIKNQIINFLEANYNEFSNLEDSETCTLDLSEDLNYEIVKYLKSIERFDYRGLCIYYVIENDEVWVENMAA